MSFQRHLRSAAVILLLSSVVLADPKLDDIFTVRMKGEGSCAEYHDPKGNDLLEKMFEDMQKIVKDTNEALSGDYETGWNDEARGLAKSFFGLYSEDGKKPAANSIDAQILTKIQEWYKDANNELQGTQAGPSKPDNKPEIFCDSTFMDYKTATDAAQDDRGNVRKDKNGKTITIGDEFGANAEVYWFPEVNAYIDFKANGDPPPGTYPNSNKKTFCAGDNNFAWVVEPSDVSYMILCPRLLTKKVPDTLDLSAAEEGTVLDKRESKSLTWLHELFHLEFPPTKSGSKWVIRSPDPKKRSPSMTKADPTKPVPSWPKTKASFVLGTTDIIGAVQAMYLALYDKATPIVKNIESYQTTKSPEAYAWMAFASYLSRHGDGKSEWSTGAARKAGTPPSTVTVPAQKRHEATAAPSTFVTVGTMLS